MNRKQKLQSKYKAPSPAKPPAGYVLYKPPKVDLKYADMTSNVNVSFSGVITSVFSNITRGDNGLNNHIGNTLHPKYIACDYYFHTTQTYNSLRLMIFQWMDPVAPTLTSLLQNTLTGFATISPIYLASKSNIKVFADHKFTLAPTAGGDTTPTGLGVHQGTVFIPERKLKPVRFNPTVNQITDGNIYVMVVSDDLAPVYPQCFVYTRVAFTD